MTNSEFSDSFDTLLNSYNTQANFGDQASKAEIVLDEYEKSVLLTQAQDIVVKSFFDRRHNSQGDGFDDSTRRQVDFSSLIKVATLTPKQYTGEIPKFDERGIIYNMPLRKYPQEIGNQVIWTEVANTTDVLFILNEKLIVGTLTTPAHWSKTGQSDVNGAYTDAVAATLPNSGTAYADIAAAEADGWSWTADVLSNTRNFVIVPINYKEYDREMTKAYAQPLKKQAWRLFQNDTQGFDIQTELIPKWDLITNSVTAVYKIRYIRRPCPIVLVDLPNNLEIDGFTKEQECELNPILHPEILQRAMELAVATRGGGSAVRESNNQ